MRIAIAGSGFRAGGGAPWPLSRSKCETGTGPVAGRRTARRNHYRFADNGGVWRQLRVEFDPKLRYAVPDMRVAHVLNGLRAG